MLRRSHGDFRYDFSVYDRRGRLLAVVEVKRRFGTNPSWAREWHAGVMERMDQPVDVNVVLVAPDRIYIWRPGADESANPDWIIDAGPWFAPYFARLKIPLAAVDPRIFEEIVGLWLRDVVQGELPEDSDRGSAGDLLEALQGGEVVQQVAA